MNFKEKVMKVLEYLNLRQKFEKQELSAEDFTSILAEYQKKYQSTLNDDLANELSSRDEQSKQDMQNMLNSIRDVLAGINEVTVTNSDEDNSGNNEQSASAENATLDGILKTINGLREDFKKIGSMASPDIPVSTTNNSLVGLNGFGNTSEYLFGVNHNLFSMNHRWNVIAANPRAAASLAPVEESTDGVAFYKELRNYSMSLRNRYEYLQRNKMLDAEALAAGKFATDFDGVDKAGVGDKFVILRQDALIARVLKLRDVTQYFPVAYGYQDMGLIFNTFFDEVSQAYQSGEVFKGGMKIENHMGYVDDVMIKMEWGPMKTIERKYIGYLNKEGSDPIKWTMIEYQLLNTLQTAQVEQNKRRMMGIYVEPEKGVAGSYRNGSTGLIYTLMRYVHQYDIKPHNDAAYRSYVEATMLVSVQEFISDVASSVTEDMDLDNHVLYLNKTHQGWWIKNVRTAYGKDTDFSGPMGALNIVPDTNIRIVWLPYLGKLPFMMLHQPGNIQFLENVPGEMLSVKMQEQMEQVRAWSTWKEGCSATFTGHRFQSRQEMNENNFEWQQIFINQFANTVTDKIDANDGFWHVTDKESSLTEVTDIAHAKAGVAYCIECGSSEKLPTVPKSGKFANISEAFSAKEEGDYIMVILGSDGNFRELERCVQGKRTINAALQPNIQGVR